MGVAELPAPPGDVRPGHLGLVMTGRVILGDIAATAVDLCLRGLLEIEATADEPRSWPISPAEPAQGCQAPREHEQILLEWASPPGHPTSLALLAADRPAALAEIRE